MEALVKAFAAGVDIEVVPAEPLMKKEVRILCVEDVPTDVALMNHALKDAGLQFHSTRVDTKAEFLKVLDQEPPDIILSDHGLPSFDGFMALAIARDKCPDVPFIFVTTALGEKMTIETFERGATDYVLKHNLSRLGPVVKNALRESQKRKELKQQEESLRESEERFRKLVEGVLDYAIFMLDADGRVATWNSGAERLTGYRAEEIVGNPLSTFFTREDVQAGVPQRVLKVAEEEGQSRYVGWRVRKDGSRFWVDGTLTALRDENGRVCGFTKIAHDITPQKEAAEQIQSLNARLEARVRERTAQLEAANGELEAFTDSVSHDLRAPLRHISGYVEILRHEAGPLLGVESKGHLQIIAEGARQMGCLIDGLLDFSRMGRVEMRRQTVDVINLVKEARLTLEDDLEKRDIEWTVHELPKVQGDPVMLRQVIVNLLSNAIKYTRSRSKAKIEIDSVINEVEIIFFVRDNGVGFDMQYAAKLFGVFQRLHSAREFEGVGIGLANVRRIISRHGGRAWAEGAPGVGATFFFSIPRAVKGEPS